MASLDSTITIQHERRPCYVDGKKAMFHQWANRQEIIAPSVAVGGHGGGVVAAVFGIVEFEDGTVQERRPNDIRFADGGGFHDTAFKEV